MKYCGRANEYGDVCGETYTCESCRAERRAETYRKALEAIGNRIGAPTMDYSPEIKMKELEQRVKDVSALVIAALNGKGGVS